MNGKGRLLLLLLAFLARGFQGFSKVDISVKLMVEK